MSNNLYWISTLTYTIVLAIILANDIRIKKNTNKVERAYRLLISLSLLFCLQDTLWGFCDAGVIEDDGVFFLSSSLFHASTVLTSFFWLYYVLVYVGEKRQMRNIYLLLDGLIIAFEVVLVGINFFDPVLFTIENGTYVTESLRPLTFANQYVVYLIVGVTTLIHSFKVTVDENHTLQKRYWSVFLASQAPILLGLFQLLYPEAPFYSLGYFLTCFIVHIFVVAKDRQQAEKSTIFHSISNTYHSMHMIDLATRKTERYIEPALLTRVIGESQDAQEMLNRALKGTALEEYHKILLEFVDLTTLAERIKDRNLISCEFVGRNYGWTRISFYVVDREDTDLRKVMVVTQVIDTEKRAQIELLFKSYNDELTGLSNRRAFEDELSGNIVRSREENLVFVSMDVNGLKPVNDSLGHKAGDELLCGAAECMKRCFGGYGKLYRTGGDEFCAIIHASDTQLEHIRIDFDECVSAWRGTLVDALSVSCGYVKQSEVKVGSIRDMSILADERMYEAKAQYYHKKGVDRSGQQDSHRALCALYTKILKINLTTDSFQIVNMDSREQKETVSSARISQWLSEFGKSGQVHPDDLEGYLSQTTLAYMSDYFRRKSSLRIFYRRKIDNQFKQVMMEIIPADDYSDQNQSLYLYVKNIDK